MAEIILSDEQAQIVTAGVEPIVLRDGKGRVLGRVKPEYSAEFIAELKRRAASPGPRFTSSQVQSRLRGLQEEWDRTGGFDEKRMHELLAQMDAADPGHMRDKRNEI